MVGSGPGCCRRTRGTAVAWSKRSKVWRDGWRNLHHPRAAPAAELALEGKRGACTLAREWADGAELTGSPTTVQPDSQIDILKRLAESSPSTTPFS